MSNTITTYRARFPQDEFISLAQSRNHNLSTQSVDKLLDFAFLYLKWDVRRTNEAMDFLEESRHRESIPVAMQFPSKEIIALSNSKINPDISDPVLFFMHNSLYRVDEKEARDLFAEFDLNIRGRLEHIDENVRTVYIGDNLQRRLNKSLLNIFKYGDMLSEEDKARHLMEMDRLLNSMNENFPISSEGLQLIYEDLNKASVFSEKVAAFNELTNTDKPEKFWEMPYIPERFLVAAQRFNTTLKTNH